MSCKERNPISFIGNVNKMRYSFRGKNVTGLASDTEYVSFKILTARMLEGLF